MSPMFPKLTLKLFRKNTKPRDLSTGFRSVHGVYFIFFFFLVSKIRCHLFDVLHWETGSDYAIKTKTRKHPNLMPQDLIYLVEALVYH